MRERRLPPSVEVRDVHSRPAEFGVQRPVVTPKPEGGQTGHRYFDFGEYPADPISGINCEALMVEHDLAHAYETVLKDQQLAVGATDVQTKRVESPEQIIEGLESLKRLSPEQTLITSSCVLNHHPREVAFGKLRAMAEAERMLF